MVGRWLDRSIRECHLKGHLRLGTKCHNSLVIIVYNFDMKSYNILFLCTGNSARSILAEALVTTLSGGKFIGYSAGSNPAGRVNPFASELIATVSIFIILS